MTLVTRHLNVLVFNNILFNESHTKLVSFRLLHSIFVYICVWNESTIPWNMLCHLLSANCQFGVLIGLLGCFMWKHSSWVMSKSAYSFLKLSLVYTTTRAIALSINAPIWTLWYKPLHGSRISGSSSIVRLPVLSWWDVLGTRWSCLVQAHCGSCTKWSLSSHKVTSELGWIEELWMMSILVTYHIILTFSWHMVVALVHVFVMLLIVTALHSIEITKHFLSISFFSGGFFIVLSI